MPSNAPGMGDNTQVDYAGEETRRLEREYGHFDAQIAALKEESSVFEIVEDDDSKSTVMELIKRERDLSKTLLGLQELEKLPHYRKGQAVDQFFFRRVDMLAKRDRKNPDGDADRLNRLLTDYDTRVLARIQEERRLAAEKAERERRAAEEARLAAERAAEEARLAAERARKPETQAAKEEVAEVKEVDASLARVEETIATAKAEEAYIETLSRPADIMRTRTASGTLGTMGTENFAEITDRAKLDLEKLRPYFGMDALEKAVNAYAKANAYSSDASVQIVGARFGKRPKSRVR